MKLTRRAGNPPHLTRDRLGNTLRDVDRKPGGRRTRSRWRPVASPASRTPNRQGCTARPTRCHGGRQHPYSIRPRFDRRRDSERRRERQPPFPPGSDPGLNGTGTGGPPSPQDAAKEPSSGGFMSRKSDLRLATVQAKNGSIAIGSIHQYGVVTGESDPGLAALTTADRWWPGARSATAAERRAGSQGSGLRAQG